MGGKVVVAAGVDRNFPLVHPAVPLAADGIPDYSASTPFPHSYTDTPREVVISSAVIALNSVMKPALSEMVLGAHIAFWRLGSEVSSLVRCILPSPILGSIQSRLVTFIVIWGPTLIPLPLFLGVVCWRKCQSIGFLHSHLGHSHLNL